MPVADSAAHGLEPIEVVGLRHVVSEPHDQKDSQAGGERQREIVVNGFCQLRPRGETFFAQNWNEYGAPEDQAEPGDRQHYERDGNVPMHDALENGPARHRSPGACFELILALDDVFCEQGDQYGDNERAAEEGNRAVADAPPVFAAVLDQDAGLRSRHGGVALGSLPNCPPVLGTRIDRLFLRRLLGPGCLKQACFIGQVAGQR